MHMNPKINCSLCHHQGYELKGPNTKFEKLGFLNATDSKFIHITCYAHKQGKAILEPSQDIRKPSYTKQSIAMVQDLFARVIRIDQAGRLKEFDVNQEVLPTEKQINAMLAKAVPSSRNGNFRVQKQLTNQTRTIIAAKPK